MIDKFIKNKLLAGSFVMVAGSMGINVVNYFYHLLMGRMLGPSAYSVLASVFSLYYLIAIIPQSAGVGIVKFTSEANTKTDLDKLYGSLKRFLNRLGLVVATLILIMSPLVSRFLHIDNFWNLALLAPIFYFSLNTMLNQSVLQGLLRFNIYVSANLVASLGKLLLGLLLVYLGYSAFGAIAGLAIATAFTFYYSQFFVGKEVSLTKSKRSLEDFFEFSIPALLQALAFTAFFSLDLILVKHFFPPLEAGLYAALSTLGKIIFFAASPVSMVMFPIVSGKRSKGKAYKHVFYFAFLATAVMAFGVVLVYYLFPDLAIGILYGKDYLAASPLLPWMGLFLAVYTLNYYLVNFLLSVGRVKIVGLPIAILIIQFFGIIYFHENLLQVIQISLGSMALLLFGILGYLLNYQLGKNGKK